MEITYHRKKLNADEIYRRKNNKEATGNHREDKNKTL
jgi:hypothetical protein